MTAAARARRREPPGADLAAQGTTFRPMTRVKVADILRHRRENRLRDLTPGRVENTAVRLINSLPIVVFETDEGLLLADGHHRLAAAVAEGKKTVEAEMRHGSRQDALDFAVALSVRLKGVCRSRGGQAAPLGTVRAGPGVRLRLKPMPFRNVPNWDLRPRAWPLPSTRLRGRVDEGSDLRARVEVRSPGAKAARARRRCRHQRFRVRWLRPCRPPQRLT